MSILDLFELGTPFSWPIIALSLFAAVLFLERFIFLHKGQIRVVPFITGIINLIKQGRSLEAITLCQSTPGPIARILKASLAEKQSSADQAIFFEILRKNAILELPDIEKRIGTILFIAQISPLIGLAGTLYSFLRGFLDISTVETYVKMTTYSQYIVSAISVSFLSLLLSIICISCFHFLHGRVRSIIFDIEWTINQVCNNIK